MKAMLLVLSMMFSGAAFAGEYTSFGRIHFQAASTWVPANYVCQKNGMLYHTRRASVNVVSCPGDASEGPSCTIVRTIPLVQPMVSTAQRCAHIEGRGECRSWETYAYNQGPTVKVHVYASHHDMAEDRNPIAVRNFTIPTCKSAPGVVAR